MALILVGAIFVGSIETVWQGQITPPYGKTLQHWQYEDEQAITLQKGEEMGRFNMGSTIILLLPKQADKFNLSLKSEDPVVMGQAMT
jgi:phosphatidylserine decarboxylase